MSYQYKRVYLVSVSGGKDSQAAWIYALKNYSKKGLVVPYFSDTGWEAEETYKHLEYLEKELNSKLTYISSDKYDGFEDMCIQKKGFPSRIGRFCIEELKIIPSIKFIREWQKKTDQLYNITGVRKDESISQNLTEPVVRNGVVIHKVFKRDIESKFKTSFLGALPKANKRKDGSFSYPKKAKEYYKKENSITTIQPVVDWTAKDVLSYNNINGTKNNPLYAKGYTRVGCFPCINANKHEVGSLPRHIAERVSALEKKVQATTTNTRPVFFHKGGELKDFIYYYNKHQYNPLDLDLGCINQFGICE